MSKISTSDLLSLDFGDRYSFISTASFEKRCLTVPRHLNRSNIAKSYIFQYLDFDKFSAKNAKKMKSLLASKDKTLKLNNSKPILSADIIHRSIINAISKSSNIVLDITTFTRESLLMVLFLINQYADKIESCHILYNSSASMDDSWLSFKVKDFRSILGFSGNILPTKKLHLMILLGFELDRAREIIDKYEPSLISIGRGSAKCSVNEELYKRNNEFVEQLKGLVNHEINVFNVSLINPFEAQKDLFSQMQMYSEYNNIIAPLNTKLSTVGAGLLALKNTDIQICYTQMEIYNFSNYSIPSEEIYHYQLI